MREKYERYRDITKRALEDVEICAEEGSFMFDVAKDFLEIAKSYFSDSEYFYDKKDIGTAIAAVAYAHAWIDAGIRLGILRGRGEIFLKR